MEKLKIILKANAIFSAISGLVLLIFPGFWADQYSTANWVFFVVGGGLLLFSALLLNTASKSTITRKEAVFIIIQDLLWVGGSALLLLVAWKAFTWLGIELIILVALIVGIFAYFQHRFSTKLG